MNFLKKTLQSLFQIKMIFIMNFLEITNQMEFSFRTLFLLTVLNILVDEDTTADTGTVFNFFPKKSPQLRHDFRTSERRDPFNLHEPEVCVSHCF